MARIRSTPENSHLPGQTSVDPSGGSTDNRAGQGRFSDPLPLIPPEAVRWLRAVLREGPVWQSVIVRRVVKHTRFTEEEVAIAARALGVVREWRGRGWLWELEQPDRLRMAAEYARRPGAVPPPLI